MRNDRQVHLSGTMRRSVRIPKPLPRREGRLGDALVLIVSIAVIVWLARDLIVSGLRFLP